MPTTGAELLSVESESRAKVIAERRLRLSDMKKARETSNITAPAADSAGAEGEAGAAVVLPPAVVTILLKADGVGTLEALRQVVAGVAARTSEVTVKIVHSGVGDVTLSDVELAANAGEALILGFNINVADGNTKTVAKQLDVKIFRDAVIYRIEDELKSLVESFLPKERIVTKEGSATVLKVFKMRDGKKTVVAGLNVKTGKLCSAAKDGDNCRVFYKVVRGGQTVLEESLGKVDLKRFKDTVNEVRVWLLI
jgi:translation initiation factor IF-2